MSLNNVKDEVLSHRSVDEPDSARKRMRMESSSRPSWSLSDKKTDQDVLTEMGVSLLDPDDLDPESDQDTSANTSVMLKAGSKRKNDDDIENVNPNVNSATKRRSPRSSPKTSPRNSPKGKLSEWSPNLGPGPSLLSSPTGADCLSVAGGAVTRWCCEEETPEGQVTATARPHPAPQQRPGRAHDTPTLEAIAPATSMTAAAADSFATLCDEVLLHIFKWLPKRTLTNCMLVCKRWRRVSCDESFWQRLELGGRRVAQGALQRILDRKPVVLRLAGSEIGEWHPNPPVSLCRVQYLDLSMCGADSATLRSLLERCRLIKLSLEAVQLDDDICTAIGLSKNLESLNLTMATGITEEGLAAILDGCTRLVSLNISWCGLETGALSVLCSRAPTSLQRLNCAGARKLTDDLLSQLTSRARRLVELDVSDCARVTAAALPALRALPVLRHLALSRLYLLPSAVLTKMGSLPSLQYLDVWGLLQDASLSALRAALPGIHINQFMHSAIARPTVGQRRTSVWGLRTRD